MCPYPSRVAASLRSLGSCMKAWRNRNIPRPLATKGTINAGNELNHPRLTIVWRFGTMMASIGTMSVARHMMKIARRNGNRTNANAYAASTDVMTSHTLMERETITLFRRYTSRSAPDQASENADQRGWVGNRTGGLWAIWAGVKSALTTVM